MEHDLPWDYNASLASNPDFKVEDIADLRAWVESEDSSVVIPRDISDKMLLCFHSACGLVLENTKRCIKTYYSTRDKAPEHFDDRDFAVPLMLESSQVLECAVLPEKTPEGYPIIYHGLFNHSPEKYHFNHAVKCLLMTTDKCVYELGPVKGVVFLFDMRGVKLGHLTRVNLISLGKFFTYIQEGMPLSIKKIYVMNSVPFFDKVMMLIKPFMKKELISLLSLFPPNTDYEAFHRDVLPKNTLPPHYGGDLPDISTLSKKNFEKLISMKPYFDAEEKHRYAFSKKSKKRAKVETNFRDLSID